VVVLEELSGTVGVVDETAAGEVSATGRWQPARLTRQAKITRIPRTNGKKR
jgi:hypothetical protein